MQQRIYIEYKIDGQLKNANAVSLCSPDGTFGVKNKDTSEIIVPANAIVSNPSVGVYEYQLQAVPGVVYTVVWKVIPNLGDQPVYVNQIAGPFSDVVKNTVRAVPDFRGSFVQGSLGNLFLSISDIDANPLTAESISLTVSKDGVPVLSNVRPDFIKAGFYTFDWSIPRDQEIGKYLVTWSYTVNDFSFVEFQEIIISSLGDTQSAQVQLYGQRISDLRMALSEMIACAQKIPVYHEEAVANKQKNLFKFTFGRWNQVFGTRIYRNNILLEDGIEINYPKGLVNFDYSVSDYDVIHADYNFRWFSDEQLDIFLQNAVSVFNIYPPSSNFSLFSVPDAYVPIVLYGAAKDALRELLLCLNFQQPQQVFGGSENAQKAFSNFETLKKNYEEEFKGLLEQKKRGKYPRTRAIVTPEYTLPGGRSRWFRYLFGGGS